MNLIYVIGFLLICYLVVSRYIKYSLIKKHERTISKSLLNTALNGNDIDQAFAKDALKDFTGKEWCEIEKELKK